MENNCILCKKHTNNCELLAYLFKCENCAVDLWLKRHIIGSSGNGNRVGPDSSAGKRREQHNSRAN